MYEPTDEEQKIIRKINEEVEQRENAPTSERILPLRPERYEDLPGLDSDGNKFPVHGKPDDEKAKRE